MIDVIIVTVIIVILLAIEGMTRESTIVTIMTMRTTILAGPIVISGITIVTGAVMVMEDIDATTVLTTTKVIGNRYDTSRRTIVIVTDMLMIRMQNQKKRRTDMVFVEELHQITMQTILDRIGNYFKRNVMQ